MNVLKAVCNNRIPCPINRLVTNDIVRVLSVCVEAYNVLVPVRVEYQLVFNEERIILVGGVNGDFHEDKEAVVGVYLFVVETMSCLPVDIHAVR